MKGVSATAATLILILSIIIITTAAYFFVIPTEDNRVYCEELMRKLGADNSSAYTQKSCRICWKVADKMYCEYIEQYG